MNKSNVVHAAIGIVLQLAIFLLTWNAWYGFALVAGIFWSREQAQKQYHIAKGRSINELQWYEGGDMTKWSKDSLLDFFAPFGATLVIAILLHS
jgi:hypothetical protein